MTSIPSRHLLALLAAAVLLSSCGGRSSSGTTGDATAAAPAGPTATDAQTLDTLKFGDSTSESAHQVATGFSTVQATTAPLPTDPPTNAASDIVQGQFGQSARRLLGRGATGDYYGGEMSLRMSVDPVKLNYFTVKTWGGDTSDSWMVLNVEGLELGWRHDYLATDEMMFHQSSGWYPGAFTYRTMRLPYHLTRGKTQVTLKLRSLGKIAFYAGGSYDNRQTRMTAPTVPLYAAYTHTGAQPDVSAEQQGTVAAGTTASENGDQVVANWKTAMNGHIASRLAAAASSLSPDDLQFLAHSYGVSWSTGYQNPAVVSQVRDALDAMVTAYAAAPTTYIGSHGNESWGGYLGPAGEAARLLKTPLAADLAASGAYGGSVGTTTRAAAWGTALRAGVDFGRTNRLATTNASFWAAWNTYLGNRALLALQPSLALKEAEAKRYLYEAAGINAWLGNDQPGGGDTPVRGTAPYGPNWFAVTSDGTTKEDCFVGGDYGEIGAEVVLWAVETDDSTLLAQGLKMLRARAPLRYPATDASGHAQMVVPDPIGCRNPYEIGAHVNYMGRAFVQTVLAASLGANVIGSDLIGFAQQGVAEGKFMSQMSAETLGRKRAMFLPDYWAAFKAQSQTGIKLPMSDGMPDFAWADRENMVVAAKAGNERFFAVLNWRGAAAMNRLARVFVLSPSNAWIGEVGIDDVQYTPTGRLLVAGPSVEGDGSLTPPDNPVNANNGQSFAIAMRADLSTPPATNRDAGRADAYTLRYGKWLVAINAHPSKTYAVQVPVGFGTVADLASGRTYTGSVTLAARSYAVFHLDDAIKGAVRPANPLQPVALGAGGAVTLGWEATPGAATYSVTRSVGCTGTFSLLASSLATTSYVDTSPSPSGNCYVVQAVDANGLASGPSPQVSASPAGAALIAPWSNMDIGTVPFAGSASVSGGTFTLQASGLDIWSNSDQFHYVFVPMIGDGSITARVVSQGTTATWAKAGVMIRASLDTASPHALMAMTPAQGAQMVWRSTPAGASSSTMSTGIVSPAWVRLTRSGNSITSAVSRDGSAWTTVDTRTIAMPSLVYAGLAADSWSSSGPAVTVSFDSVSVPTAP